MYWKLRFTFCYFCSLSHVCLLFVSTGRTNATSRKTHSKRKIGKEFSCKEVKYSFIINCGIVQFKLTCLPTIYRQLHNEIDDLRALLTNQTAKLDKLVNQISSQVMKYPKPSPLYWYTFSVQSTLISADKVQSTLLKNNTYLYSIKYFPSGAIHLRDRICPRENPSDIPQYSNDPCVARNIWRIINIIASIWLW